MQPIIKQLLSDWAENLVCDQIILDPCFAQEKAARSTVEIVSPQLIV